MLDAHREHERTAAPVLSNLAGAVAVAFHEGYKSCRGQSRVLHRRAFRANVRQVMAHTTTSFHELNLLFVDLQDAPVAVGITIKANDKAIGQRANLEIVANARHRAALWHNVAKMLYQAEDFFFTHWIGILVLYACNLVGDAVMHVVGGKLIKMSQRVLQSILARPDPCCQLIATKILECGFISFFISVCRCVHF